MRVISQDGTIDVPYEYVALVVSGGKYKDSNMLVSIATTYPHRMAPD